MEPANAISIDPQLADRVALAVFCLVTAIMVHFDPEKMSEMIQFMKNLAMTGGCVFLSAHGGGKWSVDHKIN